MQAFSSCDECELQISTHDLERQRQRERLEAEYFLSLRVDSILFRVILGRRATSKRRGSYTGGQGQTEEKFDKIEEMKVWSAAPKVEDIEDDDDVF